MAAAAVPSSDFDVARLVADTLRNKEKTIYLSCLQLKTIPFELLDAHALEELYVSSNRISLLPPQIGRLSALRLLDIRSNALEELPVELFSLSGLRELFLSDNLLTSIPSDVWRLTSLRRLDVRNNRLVSLPVEISLLDNLQDLYVERNPLTSLPIHLMFADARTIKQYLRDLMMQSHTGPGTVSGASGDAHGPTGTAIPSLPADPPSLSSGSAPPSSQPLPPTSSSTAGTGTASTASSMHPVPAAPTVRVPPTRAPLPPHPPHPVHPAAPDSASTPTGSTPPGSVPPHRLPRFSSQGHWLARSAPAGTVPTQPAVVASPGLFDALARVGSDELALTVARSRMHAPLTPLLSAPAGSAGPVPTSPSLTAAPGVGGASAATGSGSAFGSSSTGTTLDAPVGGGVLAVPIAGVTAAPSQLPQSQPPVSTEQLTAELEQLRREKQRLHERVATLETQVQAGQVAMAACQSAQEDAAHMREQLARTQSQLQAALASNSQLHDRLDMVMGQLQQETSEHAATKQRLERVQQQQQQQPQQPTVSTPPQPMPPSPSALAETARMASELSSMLSTLADADQQLRDSLPSLSGQTAVTAAVHRVLDIMASLQPRVHRAASTALLASAPPALAPPVPTPTGTTPPSPSIGAAGLPPRPATQPLLIPPPVLPTAASPSAPRVAPTIASDAASQAAAAAFAQVRVAGAVPARDAGTAAGGGTGGSTGDSSPPVLADSVTRRSAPDIAAADSPTRAMPTLERRLSSSSGTLGSQSSIAARLVLEKLSLDRVPLSNLAGVLQALQKPSLLIKYPCKAGHPHARRFVVSEDGTRIQWGSTRKDTYSNKLPLAQVRYLVVGPFTDAFRKYQGLQHVEGHERCFSLVFGSRTLDLQAPTPYQARMWIMGLQELLRRTRAGRPPPDPPRPVYTPVRLYMYLVRLRYAEAALRAPPGARFATHVARAVSAAHALMRLTMAAPPSTPAAATAAAATATATAAVAGSSAHTPPSDALPIPAIRVETSGGDSSSVFSARRPSDGSGRSGPTASSVSSMVLPSPSLQSPSMHAASTSPFAGLVPPLLSVSVGSGSGSASGSGPSGGVDGAAALPLLDVTEASGTSGSTPGRASPASQSRRLPPSSIHSGQSGQSGHSAHSAGAAAAGGALGLAVTPAPAAVHAQPPSPHLAGREAPRTALLDAGASSRRGSNVSGAGDGGAGSGALSPYTRLSPRTIRSENSTPLQSPSRSAAQSPVCDGARLAPESAEASAAAAAAAGAGAVSSVPSSGRPPLSPQRSPVPPPALPELGTILTPVAESTPTPQAVRGASSATGPVAAAVSAPETVPSEGAPQSSPPMPPKKALGDMILATADLPQQQQQPRRGSGDSSASAPPVPSQRRRSGSQPLPMLRSTPPVSRTMPPLPPMGDPAAVPGPSVSSPGSGGSGGSAKLGRMGSEATVGSAAGGAGTSASGSGGAAAPTTVGTRGSQSSVSGTARGATPPSSMGLTRDPSLPTLQAVNSGSDLGTPVSASSPPPPPPPRPPSSGAPRAIQPLPARFYDLVRKTATFIKYPFHGGEPEKRIFVMDFDNRTLRWGNSLTKLKSGVELKNVRYVVFGTHTKTLRGRKGKKYPVLPWRCFSLVLADRTVDIQASTDAEAQAWFLVIQHTLWEIRGDAMERGYMTPSQLIFKRARMKLAEHGSWVQALVSALRSRATMSDVTVGPPRTATVDSMTLISPTQSAAQLPTGRPYGSTPATAPSAAAAAAAAAAGSPRSVQSAAVVTQAPPRSGGGPGGGAPPSTRSSGLAALVKRLAGN